MEQGHPSPHRGTRGPSDEVICVGQAAVVHAHRPQLCAKVRQPSVTENHEYNLGSPPSGRVPSPTRTARSSVPGRQPSATKNPMKKPYKNLGSPPSGRLPSPTRTARSSVPGRQPRVTETAGAASTSRGSPAALPITPCACAAHFRCEPSAGETYQSCPHVFLAGRGWTGFHSKVSASGYYVRTLSAGSGASMRAYAHRKGFNALQV